MENTYLVNSADLTSVADAIRTKGETSDQLVFPDGFVTAIDGISTGAELNFEVVGGTTQPSNPKENTIWVNTSTEITSWILGGNTPSSPTARMVWISTSNNEKTSFRVLDNEPVVVSAASCKQYVSKKWKKVTAKIYKNNKWTPLYMHAYDKGDLCESVTGGWNANSDEYVTFYSDCVYLEGQPFDAIRINTVNAIDVTPYSKMTVIGNTESTVNSVGFQDCGLVKTVGDEAEEASYWETNVEGDFIIEVDIDKLTGEYFIKAQMGRSDHCRGYINEIYFE